MPTVKRTKLTGNRVLDQLSSEEFNRLTVLCEPVSLAYRQTVYRTGDRLGGAIFLVSGMLSVFVGLEEGREVEVAMIGSEGVIGAAAILGIQETPFRVLAQASSEGLCLPMPAFQRALERNPRLDMLIRRYLAVSLHSAHQLTACNALHSVAARLCRWLLMAHDRLGVDCCPLTHELVAEMLGVRRQTITAAARDLQRRDLIAYQRGSLKIINRAGLEGAACECYRAMRDYYERQLG